MDFITLSLVTFESGNESQGTPSPGLIPKVPGYYRKTKVRTFDSLAVLQTCVSPINEENDPSQNLVGPGRYLHRMGVKVPFPGVDAI